MTTYYQKSCDMLLKLGVCYAHFATEVAKIVAKIAYFLQLLQQECNSGTHKITMAKTPATTTT